MCVCRLRSSGLTCGCAGRSGSPRRWARRGAASSSTAHRSAKTSWPSQHCRRSRSATGFAAALSARLEHRHLRHQARSAAGAAFVQPAIRPHGDLCDHAGRSAALRRQEQRPSANLAVVEDFCSRLEVLPGMARAAQHDGAIRGALERLGMPIDAHDLHIAALAHRPGQPALSRRSTPHPTRAPAGAARRGPTRPRAARRPASGSAAASGPGRRRAACRWRSGRPARAS